ncbi:MAG: TAXI family TRAP transporter solute-binding subunit [Ruminococcaceae bacterium]|nr:TAXI family TRAP transporter solute-binding subunit [Oscillospiraceae bacterium]
MKKFFALMLTLLMVLSLVACGGNKDDEVVKMRFVTGSESGTYYAFGGTIAQHATNNAEGIEVIGVVGAGSQANIQELEKKGAELAFCQSDVMAYAYEGTNLFKDTGKVDCFSTVAALYMEQVQIVTCDPSIKTVADLEGKRVSIGAAGSGVYFNALDVLSCYGLSESDIIPTYQGFGDSANALKDGQIDAAFVVSGAPTTAIVELATTKTAYLVSIEDANVDKLLKASPYYSKSIIKAGTYNGQTEDVTTVAVGAVVLARNDIPEDAIYALTADIFDNYTNLVSSHAKYGELSLEFATSVTSVPYHPGAAKYFAEKNITVPTAK